MEFGIGCFRANSDRSPPGSEKVKQVRTRNNILVILRKHFIDTFIFETNI